MPYVIAALLVLLADQISKYLTTIYIPLNTGTVNLLPGILSLRNIHNYGAAFGILKNGRWFFLIITVVLFVAAAYAFSKKLIRSKPARWLAVLVLTGALGNALDRLLFGYVVDMFQFVFLKNFAIFNVADIFITCGTIVFCVLLFLEDSEEEPIPAVDMVKRKASSAVSAIRSKLPAKAAEPTKAHETKAQETRPAEDDFPVIDEMALDSVADEVSAVFNTIPPQEAAAARALETPTEKILPEKMPSEPKEMDPLPEEKPASAAEDSESPLPEDSALFLQHDEEDGHSYLEENDDEFTLDDIMAEFSDENFYS